MPIDRLPPAEWAPHAAIWTAWPADPDLWESDFEPVRRDVAGLVRALAASTAGRAGDRVRVLVHTDEARQSAERAVGDVAELVDLPYGDIWLRDTGPVFVSSKRAVRFAFNGWGGKYRLAHDPEVGERLARVAEAEVVAHPFVLEGGAVDGDGCGTLLTTRECLLNPNRNPSWRTEAEVEGALAEALGARRVVWIDRGLAGDHTDGHVDNVARFVAPNRVVCQTPTGDDDPNADVLRAIEGTLRAATTADGTPLDVVTVPSPGRCVDAEGTPVPASHLNFVIGNATVVVPAYRSNPAAAEVAVARLQGLFADRTVVACPSDALLTGGGSFHCITQQQPSES